MRMGIRYKKHNIGLRIGIILFLSLVFLLFIMKRLEPAFTAQLSFYANDMVTENVHKAVYEVFDEYEFGDLAEIINNSDGTITALETDSTKLNKAKSLIILNLKEKMKRQEEKNVDIPLMSASKFYLLNSMGPNLSFKIIPLGLINTEIKESFEDAGINQTEHKITLMISVNVLYRGFLLNQSETISTEIPLMNTIIKGDVPRYYSSGNTSGMVIPET